MKTKLIVKYMRDYIKLASVCQSLYATSLEEEGKRKSMPLWHGHSFFHWDNEKDYIACCQIEFELNPNTTLELNEKQIAFWKKVWQFVKEYPHLDGISFKYVPPELLKVKHLLYPEKEIKSFAKENYDEYFGKPHYYYLSEDKNEMKLPLWIEIGKTLNKGEEVCL